MIKRREMRWAEHVARMGRRGMHIGFWWETQNWEDNIKTDLREIGWGGMDWIFLAQNRKQWRVVLNTVISLQVP
jgi:hypothetical protein